MRKTAMRAVAALVAGATLTCAQPGTWSAVEKLERGERVSVMLHGYREVQGRVEAASPNSITIIRKGKVESLAVTDVARVTALRKGSRAKSALLGSLIGFGIGWAIGAPSAGYIADTNSPSIGTRMQVGSGFGLFGAGIGGGVAALCGGTKRETVYISERRK